MELYSHPGRKDNKNMTMTHNRERTLQRTSIVPPATLTTCILRDNYGIGSQTDEQTIIHGYSSEGATLKKRFLLDGCKLFKAIAQALYEKGFTEYVTRAIPGGPAVAGDVSATIWHKDEERWLQLTLVGSASEELSPRRDGIGLLARIASNDDPKGLGSPTWWLSPMANNQAIAKSLAALFHGTSAQVPTSMDSPQAANYAPILYTANAATGRPLY
jgi:hypothetical protein